MIGTVRRECLDWLVPISESHLRLILEEWAAHYNRGRAHMAWVRASLIRRRWQPLPADPRSRHRLGAPSGVCARSVLGGLHHEYFLVRHALDQVVAEHRL